MQKDHMLPIASEDIFWCQATTLEERLLLPPSHTYPRPIPEQSAKARSQLADWREIFKNDDELYQEWLASLELSEQDLVDLLAEEPAILLQRFSHSPAWFHTFTVAYEQEIAPGDSPLERWLAANREAMPAQEPQQDLRPLLTIVEPLLSYGYQRLLRDIQEIERHATMLVFHADELLFSLFPSLVARLLEMFSRALVLEFRVAQHRGMLPPCETVTDALRVYAQHLRQRDVARAFFADYPVLARQATVAVEQWIESNYEMLLQLSQDWPQLCARFWPDLDPGALQQVETNQGDRHRGGRSVQVLIFSSGFRLVYKSRSLAIDEQFQTLLRWLNEQGQQPAFRPLRVLDCGSHGWMEWIEAHDCTSPAEVERFYLRQGANLALLYTLEAIDFHYENIIASGEHPVLVDLESLLHPNIQRFSSSFGPAERQAFGNVSSSVMHTLLLPYRPPEAEGQGRVEVSGLGGAPGQVIPGRLLRLGGVDTGELRFVRDQAILQGGKNRPHLNGAEVDIQAYLPQICEGFTQMYRLLLHRRQELLAEHGLLAGFAPTIVRVVLRSTSSYVMLLRTLFHPYLLRNELARDRVSNVLWCEIRNLPQIKAVIASELAALRQGDVPFFTTRVDSCDLWTNTGERIPDFFACSGLESLRQLWQGLSEEDLKRQLWFIRASFSTVSTSKVLQQQLRPVDTSENISEQQSTPKDLREELLQAASAIGDRICQLATQVDESATWLGLTHANEKWQLVLADINLYNGLPGIILALAYLGALTNSEHFTTMARRGFATLRGRIEQDYEHVRSIGFFAGWGGVIAMLTHLAVLWRDDELLSKAVSLLELLPPLIDADDGLDIVSGSASCIPALLCLERVTSSPQIEALLVRCGERLAASALALPIGCGWPIFEAKRCLTGFAHGNAGFAWSLLKLAQRTGEQRFSRLALDALAYERSLYHPAFKNWQDMRSFEEQPVYCLAWCHGAPGIGLARLDTLPILDDELVQAEIQAALDATLAEGFGGNHSLCHGDLGNLELLLRMRLSHPDGRWPATCDLLTATILERGRQNGWLCGTPQHVETPGLMTGLTGICLQLLRLAEPTRIPSILTMDAPII